VLPELLPAEQDAHPNTVWIETAGLDLSITMRSGTGQVLFSRRLTTHGTCADLANVAAVVIASWTTERNYEISLQQPMPARPAPAGPTTPSAAPKLRRPADVITKSTRAFDLGLGVGSTANSAGFVGAARVEMDARAGLWGVRIGFVAETARDQGLENGIVRCRYQR
jgi:hypothetical protein